MMLAQDDVVGFDQHGVKAGRKIQDVGIVQRVIRKGGGALEVWIDWEGLVSGILIETETTIASDSIVRLGTVDDLEKLRMKGVI